MLRAIYLTIGVAVLTQTAVGGRQATSTLPVAKIETRQFANADQVVLTFTASSAGVLSTIVRSEDDLRLRLLDVDGQELREADEDLNGSLGLEHLGAVLPEAGEYRLEVSTIGGSKRPFQIGASWIPFPELSSTLDPDRRPSLAIPLVVGESRDDSLNEVGNDRWDWFVLTPKQNGTLVVAVRPREPSPRSGDLTLALHLEGRLDKPAVFADDDRENNGANESLVHSVVAGQKVYVKVEALAGRTEYRLSTSLLR